MEMSTLVALLGAVLCGWIVVAFAIRRWGPGTVRHSILCPEKKVRVRASFLVQESSFGSLKTVDVTECSQFPAAPVTCDKNCLE